MASNERIDVAVTSDDIGVGLSDELLKVQAFHDEFDIPVTHFIVPFSLETDLGITTDPTLLDAMKSVEDRGSETQLHAYRHNLFEWGYPEIVSAMDLSEEACEQFADSRFAIEAYHQKDAMRERLGLAMDEWERATGRRPTGFRSGWGSFSGTLYELLNEQGFRWSSVRFASRTGWKWSAEECESANSYPETINEAVGLTPFRQGDLVEFPILGDFGFHARRSQADRLIGLFKRQFAICQERNAPCVMVHHFHGLSAGGDNADSGYDIYREIFTWLKETQNVRFVTMDALCEAWKDRTITKPPQRMPQLG
jgi:hypothetical protein